MLRRTASLVLVLGFLLLSLTASLFMRTDALALTPTVAPPTPTSTGVPGADFVGTPLSGAAPLTVQFTDISNSILSSCTWNFGDGSGLTVDPVPGVTFAVCPSASHTYTSAGSFTVSLSVVKATTGRGNQVTRTNYIQVSGSGPTVTPTASCASLTVTGRITDATTGLGIAGATIEADTSVSHPFAATSAADGSYVLSIPGVSDYACEVIGIRSWATGYQELDLALNSAQLRAQPQLNIGLFSTTSRTSTPTPTAPTITPTTMVCNPPTPELLRVSPVTSPTSATTQVITVTLNHSTSVTVTDEAGSVTSTTPVGNVFSVTINLVPNSTNHVQVLGKVTYTQGCPPYSLSTTLDINGNPLNIVQGTVITPTPTRTPTITPTPGAGACSPVTATITAPFTFDGAGSFCWQSSNLGSYINNWNLASLTINGVNLTGKYVPSSAYPARINGFWYVSYTGNFPWSHFESK